MKMSDCVEAKADRAFQGFNLIFLPESKAHISDEFSYDVAIYHTIKLLEF